MAFDLNSFLIGGATTIIIGTVIILAILSLIIGKVNEQIKYVLTKLFSRLSLALIAISDSVAAFDPTHTFLGFGIAPVCGILVFFSEWGFHDNFALELNKIGKALVTAAIATVIVLIPFPVTGLAVAWFGFMGDKKRK